jgi:hypothetical protein
MKLIACLLPLALGCVDSVEDDVQLDETAQTIATTNFTAHTCANQQFCNFDLGPAPSDRACFISGIRGAAAANGGFGYGVGSLSIVGIYSGNFQLTIYPPVGNFPVTVTTTCVSSVQNRTASQHWSPDFGPSVQLSGTTASSRCFLTQVGMFDGGMTHYNDSVRTWRDSAGNWFLGGSSTTGLVDANAICFDAQNVGEWGWGQGVPGSITGNLAPNGNHDVACGLTEIGGVFTTNSSTDGVFLGFASKLKTQWIWTLANYKHGAANCVR